MRNKFRRKNSNLCCAIDRPLLSFTIWPAGVIYETGLVAARFCIKHSVRVQTHQVIVWIFWFTFDFQSPFEFSVINDLANVFNYKLTLLQVFFAADAPATIRSPFTNKKKGWNFKSGGKRVIFTWKYPERDIHVWRSAGLSIYCGQGRNLENIQSRGLCLSSCCSDRMDLRLQSSSCRWVVLRRSFFWKFCCPKMKIKQKMSTKASKTQ